MLAKHTISNSRAETKFSLATKRNIHSSLTPSSVGCSSAAHIDCSFSNTSWLEKDVKTIKASLYQKSKSLLYT